jgi:hypothetical protein
LIGSSTAWGQTAPPPAPDKKEKEKESDIDVSGRVFYIVEMEDLDEPKDKITLDHDLRSVRLEVDYRYRKWLRAVLEAELDGRIRDAYIRVKRDELTAQVGNFKPPGSALMLESLWDLPTTTRGLLHEVFTERLQIGGRRPGLQAGWESKGPWQPRVTAGVFRPSVYGSEPLPDTDPAGPDDVVAAARFDVDNGPLEIGAFGQTMMASRDLIERHRVWAAGADVVVNSFFCPYGMRAWVELIVGSSPFTIGDEDTTMFASGRGILTFRVGNEEGRFYVEPYAMAGLLDPDLDYNDDTVMELAAGVNVGAWRILRVGLELTVQRVENPPANLDPDLTTLDPFLIDREVLRLFVGAKF